MESGICSDGKHLLVIFGGKVGVGVGVAAFCHEDGLEEKYQTVFLQQCVNKHEVGEDISDKEEVTEELIELCFNDVAQVDVLIKNLERVKQKLIEQQ